MSNTVGDLLVKRLSQWGVERVYGYTGDGIHGILGAFYRAGNRVRLIQVQHEEMAASMACAHAKFTSEVGVCLATSGPGAIHLLNGLYDAKMDHQPVVAIVGQQSSSGLGGDCQQEVDLVSLFKDVAHECVHIASDPVQVHHLVDRSIRISRAERTVTCIILPNDIQELDAVEKPPQVHGTVHSGIEFSWPRILPKDDDLRCAAKILNQGKRVAILIGAGALGAADEVIEVAELLGAGVAKALPGKAALPDDLPFVTGAIGPLGTKPSWDLMSECDTFLMVGSSFPDSEFLPQEGQARGVQIDMDARMLSLRYPMEANLRGDSAETLRALIPYLERKKDRSWRKKIEEGIVEWWKVLKARAMNKADPINPQRIFWELSPRLPEKCILTSDSGNSVNWFARDIKIRKGMMASLSGTRATMCPGVSYAIAAKFAYPERVSIALVGDGAMQMLGVNGLIMIAKHWREWADPRLIVLVLNNRDPNLATWEQRIFSGDSKFPESQEWSDFPFASYAELFGLKGIRVDQPDEIGLAWDEALEADRPALIEAITDPNVSTIPPHLTLEQMKNITSAFLKGDAKGKGMVRQPLVEAMEAVLPYKD